MYLQISALNTRSHYRSYHRVGYRISQDKLYVWISGMNRITADYSQEQYSGIFLNILPDLSMRQFGRRPLAPDIGMCGGLRLLRHITRNGG